MTLKIYLLYSSFLIGGKWNIVLWEENGYYLPSTPSSPLGFFQTFFEENLNEACTNSLNTMEIKICVVVIVVVSRIYYA